MKILITGKNGQVVQSFLEISKDANYEVITLGRPEVDFANPSNLKEAIIAHKPDAMINAAAYTAVDKAESEPEIAKMVNVIATQEIAKAASELEIPLVHISTDYVFSGDKDTPYVETDEVAPCSIYGKTKLAGEEIIPKSHNNYAIFRTAWVFSPFGNNFVKTMLRLGETRDELNVVADQFGCPTSALEIARAIKIIVLRLIEDNSQDLRGIFHLTAGGETNWAGFAKEIFTQNKEMSGKEVIVNSISTEQYPTPAKRPKNSRLNCDKLATYYGIKLPNWEISLKECLLMLNNSSRI